MCWLGIIEHYSKDKLLFIGEMIHCKCVVGAIHESPAEVVNVYGFAHSERLPLGGEAVTYR